MRPRNFHKILTKVSPENSKKDRGAMAETFKRSIETLEMMRNWGVYTDESLAKSGQTLAKEFLDIGLEIRDKEEEIISLPQEREESA